MFSKSALKKLALIKIDSFDTFVDKYTEVVRSDFSDHEIYQSGLFFLRNLFMKDELKYFAHKGYEDKVLKELKESGLY